MATKKENRTKIFKCRFTEREYMAIEEKANQADLSLSDFARSAMLSKNIKTKADKENAIVLKELLRQGGLLKLALMGNLPNSLHEAIKSHLNEFNSVLKQYKERKE